jgi:hypothetical protein
MATRPLSCSLTAVQRATRSDVAARDAAPHAHGANVKRCKVRSNPIGARLTHAHPQHASRNAQRRLMSCHVCLCTRPVSRRTAAADIVAGTRVRGQMALEMGVARISWSTSCTLFPPWGRPCA